MNKKLLCLIFYCLSIAFCNLTFCQEQQAEKSLVQILLDIEKQHDVKFSFETKTIANISISPLHQELSIKQILDHLNLVTDLDFEMLNDRFIVITAKTALDIQNKVQQLKEVIITNYLTKGISKRKTR